MNDSKNPKNTLTTEQAQSIFNHYYPIRNEDSHNIGILIGLTCGLRLSEMLALTWDDYDGGFLHITKSLERDALTTKMPKEGKSRTIVVPSILAEILNGWIYVQKQYFKSINLSWTSKTPIVNSPTGTCILYSDFQRWIQNERKANNLPSFFSYYHLRHFRMTKDLRIIKSFTKGEV